MEKIWYFSLLVLAIIFFNDLICGSVSNTHNSRYTMRVNWLLIFAGLLISVQLLRSYFSEIDKLIDIPKE